MSRAKIYYLHEGLPRQAPGSDDSTRATIRRLRKLPEGPRVLDVGCGPGRSAIVLAQELSARVTAIDIHQPYLDHLAARAEALGLSAMIRPVKMSMARMKFRRASFDLIWAEGSAYFLGIGKSLETWLPLLDERGQVAFTELCWLTGDRPAEAIEYWAGAYPEMATPADHVAAATRAGYLDCQYSVLPESDWWVEYLTPLEARMELLAAEAAKDRQLALLIEDSRRAIDLYRRHSASFGYVFFIAAR